MMNISCWRSLGVAPILRRGFPSLIRGYTSNDPFLILANSVVKVGCTSHFPKHSAPWDVEVENSTSSAFVIGDGKLLTNAHCVRHHFQVTVQRGFDTKTKYIAKVLAEAHDCDLALLSVEGKEFWDRVTPLRLGGIPSLLDTVTVVGYPSTPNRICVREGSVSRVEVMSYGYRRLDLLMIQVDCAINFGNNGPALNEKGEVVGIPFMSDDNVRKGGYLIPTSVINHFLTDYERNGKYTGFPWLPVILQKLNSETLCEYLKLSLHKGLLVRDVEEASHARKFLKKGDVIISVDNIHIGDMKIAGKIFNADCNLKYLLSAKFVGDIAQLGIVREGISMTVPIVLEARNCWVPYSIDCRPSFLIVGGLVFTQLEYGSNIVILQRVLRHPINKEYEGFVNNQVITFNGTPIGSLRDLTHLVDECKDEFMIFELGGRNYVVVLEREHAMAALPFILHVYGVPVERSEDLW